MSSCELAGAREAEGSEKIRTLSARVQSLFEYKQQTGAKLLALRFISRA